MAIYFFVIIILFLNSFLKKNIYVIVSIVFFLCLFLCFGYMCGSDWKNYEVEYYNHYSYRSVEWLFFNISNYLEERGVDFWTFHIFFKVVSYILIIRILMYYEKKIFFPLMLFVASFGFFLFINCPFRNLIAIAVFQIAIYFLNRGNYWGYYFIVFIAMGFHLSTVIALFFPILPVNKFSSKKLFWFYALSFIILLFVKRYFVNILSFFPDIIFFRINAYSDSNLIMGSLFSPGILLRFFCLWGMLHFREQLIKMKAGKTCFHLTYLYLILHLISYAFPIMFRLAFILSPCFVIMIYRICLSFQRYSNRMVIQCLFWMVSMLITYSTINSVFYVPYTNYIPYVIRGNFPSYQQRVMYNQIHNN